MGTTSGGGGKKTRLGKTTGTQKPGCSKLPGSGNPAAQIFRVEPGISTRRPGLRLGLPTDLELFLRENGIEHYLDVLLGEEIESVAMLQECTDNELKNMGFKVG